jgi:CheY-like chemotaxis protein
VTHPASAHLLSPPREGKLPYQVRGEKPILLVDDSEHDLLFMKYALDKCDLGHRVISLHDGRDAIEYLTHALSGSDPERYPLPCLVITDVKMPRVDGLGLLAWMRAQPGLESVPKLVLSSSGEDSDRNRAEALGCSAYFVKPTKLQSLVKLVEELGPIWIERHCGTIAAGGAPRSADNEKLWGREALKSLKSLKR